MPKTCCFLTSFFSGFGLDFGASWASKMEPSWPFLLPATKGAGSKEPSQVRCLSKMASWSAPGSILKAPGLDFEGSGVNFFEIFACFWACVPITCRELGENLPRYGTPVSIDNLLRPGDVGPRSSQRGGAAVVPPGGFAIE